MKNPLKSLKSSWNRARVNHPFKSSAVPIATLGGGTMAASAMMIPLDGGISFLATGFATTFGTLYSSIKADVDNKCYPHDSFKELTHNDIKYVVSAAQKHKYQELDAEIDKLKEKFRHATSEQARKKYHRRAQKHLNHQEDILDSANVRRADIAIDQPEMSLSYRQRKSGN